MSISNRPETTKSFAIKVNTSEIDQATKSLTKFDKVLDESLGKEKADNIATSFRKTAEELTKIDKMKDLLSQLGKTANTKENRAAYNQLKTELDAEEKKQGKEKTVADVENQKVKIASKAWEKVTGYAEEAWSKIKDYAKTAFKDAVKELKDMISYDSSGLFYSSKAKTQQLEYGLSDSQNYAMSKSLSYLGLSSYEDLATANSEQQEKFAELMGKYSAEYTKNEQSGVYEDIADLTEEFKDLKKELTYDLIDWLVENKTDIINTIKLGFEFMKVGTKVFMSLLEFIAWFMNLSGTASETSDVISNYTTSASSDNNSTTNNNVTVSNNFNNVNSNETSTLANAGNLVAKQILSWMNT